MDRPRADASASRVVAIGDNMNLRHLGDYETASGRRTRGDRLFRGGRLDLAGEEDIGRFAATGVRLIFDLRSQRERTAAPLGEEVRSRAEVVELGISPGGMGRYLAGLKHLPPEDIDCRAAMVDMHYQMLDAGEPVFRALFRHLVRAEGPVLIMCATGKDRTGVASALLLSALGVPRETILADYLISADVYRGHELRFARDHGLDALGVDLELVRDVFTVHPEYLGAVWRRIDELAGGVERFLSERMHLTAADLAKLRETFTA